MDWAGRNQKLYRRTDDRWGRRGSSSPPGCRVAMAEALRGREGRRSGPWSRCRARRPRASPRALPPLAGQRARREAAPAASNTPAHGSRGPLDSLGQQHVLGAAHPPAFAADRGPESRQAAAAQGSPRRAAVLGRLRRRRRSQHAPRGACRTLHHIGLNPSMCVLRGTQPRSGLSSANVRYGFQDAVEMRLWKGDPSKAQHAATLWSHQA